MQRRQLLNITIHHSICRRDQTERFGDIQQNSESYYLGGVIFVFKLQINSNKFF